MKIIDINSLSLDDCRHYLAMKLPGNSNLGYCRALDQDGLHPFPATMDAAMDAILDGWGYLINRNYSGPNGTEMWFCSAVCLFNGPPLCNVKTEADDRILAVYRLAVACDWESSKHVV